MIHWVSPSITRVIGWTGPELLGRRTVDFLHPDDLPDLMLTYAVVGSGAEATARARVRHADGDYHWYSSRISPIRGDGGAVVARVSAFRTIDAEVAAQRALQESEARYRLLAENATDVVYQVDLDGFLTWVSDGIERILGRNPVEVVGRSVEELVVPDDVELLGRASEEALAGRGQSVRVRATTTTGETRWIEATIHPMLDDTGAPTGFVGGWRDVHAEVLAHDELDRRARTDALTGLLNRAEAISRLETLLTDRRRPGEHLGVAFCDLDDFKAVNDDDGHAAGDRILTVVADRIRGCLRASDVVARIGGDEILLLLDALHDTDEAVHVLEKVGQAVSRPVSFGGREISSTISIGVTLVRPGDTADSLLARADRAMFRAKREGRNRVASD